MIAKLLPEGTPSLILLDELMNYVNRSRKSGLGGQLHSFLHNLSEVARGRKNVVLAVSIPGSELEMTVEDDADFERFKKILDRLGKAVLMSAETETSEIIRRRLFEWEGLPSDAKATVREYAEWIQDHRDQMPTWSRSTRLTKPSQRPTRSIRLPCRCSREVARCAAISANTRCPSPPSALGRRSYRMATRGVRRTRLSPSAPRRLGTHASGLLRSSSSESSDSKGPLPLTSRGAPRPTRSVSTWKPPRQSRRHGSTARWPRPFSSSRTAVSRGAKPPFLEIRLAVSEPGIDLASVDQCLEALTEACYYLHPEKGGYRFEFKGNG